MTLNEFLEHGTHFINFPAEQLEGMFNREAIEELPSKTRKRSASQLENIEKYFHIPDFAK